jgi:predicted GNAT family N-acyltransferase
LKQTGRKNGVICDAGGADAPSHAVRGCLPADHRMSATVRPARDEAEIGAALQLRATVFCEEQGVPLEADRDGLDDDALHVVAIDGGELLGACRVVLHGTSARFGRLCVRRDARGRGLARALLDEAERQARAAGAERMTLHAQTGALGLYRRAGYEGEGEPFDEEGIEHLRMSRSLR